MRWPFRRRPVEGPQGTVPSAVRAPARQWAALPAIHVTIPTAAPLVVGPAPVVPPLRPAERPVVRTRAAAERAEAAVEGAAVESPAGVVTGLARPVVRETAAPVVRHEEQPSAPAVRRAARPVPTEVPPLVDAVDEYVGEPREPAEPHRAPGWLRFMPSWAKQGQPELPVLPAGPSPVQDMVVAEPPSFLPPELRTAPAARVELPPRMQEDVAQAADAVPPAVRERRPNLGQSRRLGLGAPIQKPDLVHPVEPPPTAAGTDESPREPRGAAEPAPHVEPVEPPPDAGGSPAPGRAPTPEATRVPSPGAERGRPAESAGTLSPGPTRPAGTARVPSTGAGQPAQVPPPGPARTAPTGATRPSPPGATQPLRPARPVEPVVPVYRATTKPATPPDRTKVPLIRPGDPRFRRYQQAPTVSGRPPATVVDRVPAALAGEVRARQHADVSDVPVFRGPKVGEAARSRGARAFASGGAVFLPDEAGPVDAPHNRGLLAHELVHAVQQRALGSRLPAPDSPLGRRLEAQAQAAERHYSGEAGAEPPPLIHAPAPPPTPAPEPDLSAPAQLSTEPARAPVHQEPPPSRPFDAATTAEVDKIATESAKHVVAEWTNPALQRRHTGTHPAGGGHRNTTPPVFDAASRREQLVAAALARNNAAGGQLSTDDLSAIDRQVASESLRHGITPPYEAGTATSWMHAITGTNTHYGFGATGLREPVGHANSWWGERTADERPAARRVADQMGLVNPDTATQFDTDTWWQQDEDTQDGEGRRDRRGRHDEAADESRVDLDSAELDELATRLYDRLRSRLRTELLVDRERAGLLTDFR